MFKRNKKEEATRQEYWILYLSIIFGISGGIVGNIIDRNIPHGYVYNTGMIAFFVTFLILTYRAFKSEIKK